MKKYFEFFSHKLKLNLVIEKCDSGTRWVYYTYRYNSLYESMETMEYMYFNSKKEAFEYKAKKGYRLIK